MNPVSLLPHLVYHSGRVFDGTYAPYRAICFFSFSSTYRYLLLMTYKYKSWIVCCTYLFLNTLTTQHLILAEILFLKWYYEKLYQMVKLPNSTIIQYYTMTEQKTFLCLISLFISSLSPACFWYWMTIFRETYKVLRDITKVLH
jgi:hypothetical protein